MISGIIPPLVTPLNPDRSTDIDGAHRLIEHVLGGEVHGLFVLGTTGEGPAIDGHQQQEVVAEVCKFVDQRVPVLVGITHSSFQESVQIANFAAEHGADAVVVAPPPYYGSKPADLLELLDGLTAASSLPVILYNIPSNSNVSIGWQTVRQASQVERVVGFKDSSGDMVQFHKVRQATAELDEFTVMVGPEELLAESVLMGADGAIPGGANLFPHLYRQLYDACVERRMPDVYRLHAAVIRISQLLYEVDDSSMRIIRVLKACLAQMGVCGDRLAAPFGRLDSAAQTLLEKRFETVSEIVAGALNDSSATAIK
jgi:dihydrodipicolinate synthase/N-acetylneuraminate lyase